MNNKIANKNNMKRNSIRLTESQLKKIVTESAIRILNEVDTSQMPIGDFYTKNNWWKEQVDRDFPNHGKTGVTDWRMAYYNLEQEKKDLDKRRAKAEKMKAKQEREQKKKDAVGFYRIAAYYTLDGEDSLVPKDKLGGEEYANETPEDWYDGITRLPIVTRDGQKVWANIDSVGYSIIVADADISAGWGILWGKGMDTKQAYISFKCNIYPEEKRVDFQLIHTNNQALDMEATSTLANKYVNSMVKKNYKTAVEKYKRYRQ